MTAITVNETDKRKAIRFLEDVTITNQTENTTVVKKAVRVPQWANRATFYIFYDSAGGSTPLFDFVVGVPDFGDFANFLAPTDDTDALLGNQAWDGITQITGTGPYVITINIGPDLTADDTGPANASCTYDIRATLPPILYYTYTTDGTTDDEDYAFRIVVHFKP